jgi:hypothetical protein
MRGLYSLLAASDEDIDRAKKPVMHVHHPSRIVKAVFSNNCRIKKSKHKISMDKDAVRIVIKAFLKELTSLLSCFNRQKYHFIKCGDASGRSKMIMPMLMTIFRLLL